MRRWLSSAGNVASVRPVGDLDLASAEQLRGDLLEAAELAKRLVVCDLAEASYLDSTALGVLVGAAVRCRQVGKQLLVINAGPHAEKVIRLTGTDWLLPSPTPVVPAQACRARYART